MGLFSDRGRLGHIWRRALPLGAVALLALATFVAPAGTGPAAAAPRAVQAAALAADTAPGPYAGLAFDACSAPSEAAMSAWSASPYRAVGIYFAGINRFCSQPELTADWVSTVQGMGWHLVPIYVGLQASCTTSGKRYLIDNRIAAAQGRSAADEAVAAATGLGLPSGSVLIDDMESYRTGDAACRQGVLDFVGGWSRRLHELGYLSGFYGSIDSGVADQVANYNAAGYVRPDYLDFARWDGVAGISHPTIPASYWYPDRRMKQYRGSHDETWGGVTINIDNDYVDFGPQFGDLTGDGWSDLLARQVSNGGLYLYPGNGTALGARTATGWGWDTVNAITRLGDINGDGAEDVFGREAATGYLWLYPGGGGVFDERLYWGAGWNTMRELTAVGDFNRDGHNDLVAVQSATGYLYLYTGNGVTFTGKRYLGAGWNTVDELAGVGDFNHDGYVDVVARQKSTGYLYLYTGNGSGIGARMYLGAGWGGFRDITSIGDFNRDSLPDLLAIEKATGYLYLYAGNGTGIGGRTRIGTGWGGMQPLA